MHGADWLVVVAAASHGREDVSNEACSNRDKNCSHRMKGLTSDKIWKLMNLMGMNLAAGVESLAHQPMEKITVTS